MSGTTEEQIEAAARAIWEWYEFGDGSHFDDPNYAEERQTAVTAATEALNAGLSASAPPVANQLSREQIARAIHDGPTAQEQYRVAGIEPHSWEDCGYRDQYFGDADEVLTASAALSVSASAVPANEHHDAEERVLHYGRTVRNGVHTDRPDGFTDVEWHLSAMADTGTSHNLPGRLYIVQCEWCPKAFAAETKAEAMKMFRIHEREVQEVAK